MSTKIYYAYRIPKSRDILKDLLRIKEIGMEMIAEDSKYLQLLHGLFMKDVAKKLKDNPNDRWNLETKKENINGEFNKHAFDFFRFLENNSKSSLKADMSTQFDCSIFYDRKYWYIKFFPNYGIEYRILEKAVEELQFEDFHYQDSTDRPENITARAYNAREKKWDELTESSGGNYVNGFQYNIISPHSIKELITKFFWTGKPLFDHLAYKFDTVFFKV